MRGKKRIPDANLSRQLRCVIDGSGRVTLLRLTTTDVRRAMRGHDRLTQDLLVDAIRRGAR